MKILRKIVVYSLLTIITLVLALILIAELSENFVAKIALEQFNKDVDAKVSVGDIDLSFIADFPMAIVEFKDVMISTETDTLALVKHIYISVEMTPLLDSQFNITKIEVEGGTANYHIDKEGKTNFDAFLVASEEQESDTSHTVLLLSLDHLEISNLSCTYNDKKNDIATCLFIDEALTQIYIDTENTKASFNGILRAKNCYYPESKINLMEETKLSIDVSYHNGLINFEYINIESDGAKLSAYGKVKQDSSVYTNIHISSSEFDINELKKYVPDSLLQAYQIHQLSGFASFQANIEGQYNDSLMPNINAQLQLRNGYFSASNYPSISNIKLSGKYSNGAQQNNQTTSLTIDTLAFESGNNIGELSGSIENLDTISYRLKAKMTLDLKELKTHLPDSIVEDLNGKAKLQLFTKGVLPQKMTDHFVDYVLARTNVKMELSNVDAKIDSTMEFRHWNGSLNYNKNHFEITQLNGQIPNYQLTLKNTSVKGNYSGQLSKLSSIGVNLSQIDISTTNSQLSGTSSINDLDHPNYSIEANAKVDLNEFSTFVPDSLIKSIGGTLEASITSSGTINLDSIGDQAMDIVFKGSSFKTQLNNINIQTADSLINISNLNGQVALHSDSLKLNKLNGSFNTISFNTDSANIVNIYNAFLLNQADTIKVDGNFNFGDIDYTTFTPFMVEDTTISMVESEEPTVSNYLFKAKGKITANSFKYDNALLQNLSALYNVSDSLYIVDQFKFDAFKGSMNSSVRYQDYKKDEQRLFFKNVTDKMDIHQLLSEFDDFKEYGNTFISKDQLTGFFSTDLLGEVVIRDSIIMEDIRMQGGILLEDGRLQNYDIAMEMGGDYGIPGMEDIIFKTMDTKIFVFDNAIYAPQTDIKSNKFNVTLFGMQNFNLDCQYHLRFYLKEILRKGQTKRLEKKQTNEKETKDGGGIKGLISLFAIYKVKDGATDKSDLENEKSDERTDMKRKLRVKARQIDLIFDPRLVRYETGVNE